jgi:hypothetical protein
MIDRAELWVQRNRTLNVGVMKLSLVFASSFTSGYRRKISPQSSGLPPQQLRARNSSSHPDPADIGAVVQQSALAPDQNQSGADQNVLMRRDAVAGHLAKSRDIAGLKAVRMNLQEISENSDPGGLAKRAKPGRRDQIGL